MPSHGICECSECGYKTTREKLGTSLTCPNCGRIISAEAGVKKLNMRWDMEEKEEREEERQQKKMSEMQKMTEMQKIIYSPPSRSRRSGSVG